MSIQWYTTAYRILVVFIHTHNKDLWKSNSFLFRVLFNKFLWFLFVCVANSVCSNVWIGLRCYNGRSSIVVASCFQSKGSIKIVSLVVTYIGRTGECQLFRVFIFTIEQYYFLTLLSTLWPSHFRFVFWLMFFLFLSTFYIELFVCVGSRS